MKRLLFFALLLVSFSLSAKEHSRPNIIFFIADDMTRDMFNCLPEGKGKNLTPNLDALAEEGCLMLNQHVASTVCTPSRYNVLTGKYATRAYNPQMMQKIKKNQGQKVVEWNAHIMPGEVNLAKILTENDYTTAAVGKNHVIEVKGHQKVGLNDDFNTPKIKARQLRNYELTQKAYHQAGFEYAEGLYYENPDFNGPRELAVHNLDWTTEAAVKFIKQKHEQPFFLYFATTLPHGPLAADRAWNADRRITPVGYLEKPPQGMPDKSTIPERLKAAGLPANDRKANLLWLDDAIGTLIHTLKASGKWENTIIFFFNDHGQFAKGTVYQGATHNPSIVWKKGGFAVGKVSEALVSNVDFAPTILDFAKIKKDGFSFDGKSFFPVLQGEEEKEERSMYFEIGYSRGVRLGRYKYIAIRYPQWVTTMPLPERNKILKAYNAKLKNRGKAPNNTDPTAPFGHVQIIPGGGDAEFPATRRYPHYNDSDQLYDLSKDPKEQNNLIEQPEYADILRKLKKELQQHIATIPGSFGEFKER